MGCASDEPITILIKDNWALNLGDVAIAESMIDQLRTIAPDAEIILESSHPEITRRYFDDVQVIPRLFEIKALKHTKRVYSFAFVTKNLPFIRDIVKAGVISFKDVYFRGGRSSIEAIDAYNRADVIFSAGGDFMSEHYGYLLRAYEISLIRKLGKPLVLYAQSIGPFSKRNLPLVRRALNKADLILARDATTFRLMHEYGVTACTKRTADCVILLKKQRSERVEEMIRARGIGEDTIAIVVRDAKYTDIGDEQYARYRRGIASIVERLEAEGHKVVFVAPNEEDFRATEALKDEHGLRNWTLETYDFKPSEIKYLFSRIKLLVSGRMHPIIIASTAGTPVVCTGKEFKMKDYMSLVGLARYYMDMIPFDEEACIERIHHMVGDYDATKANLRKDLAELERMSRRNMEYASELLKRIAHRPASAAMREKESEPIVE